MKRVVIVGGGISGLAAAYALEQNNLAGGPLMDYQLWEASDRLGGKVQTERRDGFVIEAGPDSFVGHKPGVLELVRQLGLEDRLLPTSPENSGSYVWSRGRLHRLPEGLMLMVPSRATPFLTSSLISWPGKIRMTMDLFIPPQKSDHEESLEQFICRRLGREALDRIAEPLVAGIHAASPETMSVRAGFPRFIEMEQEHGSLIRAAMAARRRAQMPRLQTEKTHERRRISYFMSLRGGMAELTEALTEHLPSQRVRLQSEVKKIRRQEDGAAYELVLADGVVHAADAVILATPAYVTAGLLADMLPETSRLLNQISYASSATVSLAYERRMLPRPLQGSGFVVPAVEKRRIRGVSYSSQKWRGRVPDENTVLLRAFLGGAGQQDLLAADRAVMIEAVREELRQILGITGDPLLHRCHVWPRAMPQYQLGHLQRVASIKQAVRRCAGLHLAGAAYEGIGLGDCIRSGRQAAQQIVDDSQR